MTRLSSGLSWYRYGMPALYVIGAAVLVKTSQEIGPVLPFMLLGIVGYIVWFGWRLSEVWLDGDVLQVKGIGRIFSGCRSPTWCCSTYGPLGAGAPRRVRAGPESP